MSPFDGFDEAGLDDFKVGRATDLWRVRGADPVDGGVLFSVWAPHAGAVSVGCGWCAWKPGGPAPTTWADFLEYLGM